MENGKHTQVVTFGKQLPSAAPRVTEPTAHQRIVMRSTGAGPSINLPRTPIQKLPTPPTIAPKVRSRRVTGACHQILNFCCRRAKNLLIILERLREDPQLAVHCNDSKTLLNLGRLSSVDFCSNSAADSGPSTTVAGSAVCESLLRTTTK